MIVVPPLVLASLIVLGAVGGTAAYLALMHLGKHLGSSGRPRRRSSGLGERWERHQSARLGFTTETR